MAKIIKWANSNMTVDGYHETGFWYNTLALPARIESTAEETGYNYAFESFSYGGGRIEGPDNTVRHYVTDHLGNVRAIVTADNVLERNDYYPFGGRHARSTLPVLTSNRWRLGAKEIQPSAIGSLVDFGARMYDPFTGRWTTQDPMAWKYLSQSPYLYCSGNPINRIDSDGTTDFFNIYGQFMLSDNIDNGDIRITSQSIIDEVKGLYRDDYLFYLATDGYSYSLHSAIGNTFLSYENALKVLNYYNSTGIPISDNPVSGHTFFSDPAHPNFISVNISRLSKPNTINNEVLYLFDNSYNIISTLIHEGVHYNQSKNGCNYNTEQKELEAIAAQKLDPSWKNTTEAYKSNTQHNEDKYKRVLAY